MTRKKTAACHVLWKLSCQRLIGYFQVISSRSPLSSSTSRHSLSSEGTLNACVALRTLGSQVVVPVWRDLSVNAHDITCLLSCSSRHVTVLSRGVLWLARRLRKNGHRNLSPLVLLPRRRRRPRIHWVQRTVGRSKDQPGRYNVSSACDES